MLEILKHSFIHSIIDTLKMLPILFLAYLFMETLEHFEGEKFVLFVKKSRKLGPLLGSALGIIPQCGFSGGIASLYAAGAVTTGTLFAVILSTSDELLPILLSSSVSPVFIATFLAAKFLVSLAVGFLIDFVLRKNHAEKPQNIHEFCEKEHCSCDDGIFLSALKHTVKIVLIIIVVLFALNFLLELLPEESIKAFLNTPILSQVFACLIGLIPSCSVSVLLSNLYVSGALGLSSLFCGLFTNGGIALLVLYKSNSNKKANLIITASLFVIGLAAGLLCGFVLENIL